MKENYIKELDRLLNDNNIENKKEILDKYKKRYDFGLESGLTEEEIEQMLGTPTEIIAKFQKDSETEETVEETSQIKEEYTIDVQTLSEDVIFKDSKDEGVHVELENTDLDAYDIQKTDKSLSIHFLKRKFFSLNRKKGGSIFIELPRNTKMKEVNVSTTSGDINIPTLKTETLKVSLVSGDLKFDSIEADTFICHLVSADGTGDTLLTKEIRIDTVSGDFKVDFAVADNAKIDTVSGDVKITEGKIGNVSSTSVTGEVTINKQSAVKSVKNYVKGLFKNEE